jgi:fructose-1,6-bisphosphatase II
MLGRLAPKTDDEAAAIRNAGMSVERIYERDELVAGDALFAATGISGGSLLAAPRRVDGTTLAESLLITDGQVRHIRHTTTEPIPAP